MGEVKPCYYRKTPPKGYPADYYLWPRYQKECKGKKTCAPPLPDPIKTQKELDEFLKKVQEAVGVPTKRLPYELKSFFVEAKKERRIRQIRGSMAIVKTIQRVINCAKGRDVFIFIGTGHERPGQARLVNDIFEKLKDVTLVGLENRKINPENMNIQENWDNFLVKGEGVVRWRVEPKDGFLKRRETEIWNERPELFYKKCLNVVMTDIPHEMLEQTKKTFPEEGYFHLMREIFAAASIEQKLNGRERNVVVIEGGSFHGHRSRLPAFIKYLNPRAMVMVITVDGGVYAPPLLFDKTVKGLNWQNRSFILKLGSEFVEGDLVISLAHKEGEDQDVKEAVLIHTMEPLP